MRSDFLKPFNLKKCLEKVVGLGKKCLEKVAKMRKSPLKKFIECVIL
jgi:hypothetical protein